MHYIYYAWHNKHQTKTYFCLMRIIFIYIFTSFSFICFGAFPTQNSIPLDTIKELKKETLEEYRNRIKKQLFSNDNDLY